MSLLKRFDEKTLWELIAAALFLAVFLVVATLSLWPMGKLLLVWQLLKGFALFWIVLSLTAWALGLIQRMLRVESDPPSVPYFFTNLAVSAFVQLGWSAFAALTVASFLAGSSTGLAGGLHLVGFLSCVVAFAMVGVFYQGTLYRLVNGPLGLIGYIVLAVWPATGQALYGWFFGLF